MGADQIQNKLISIFCLAFIPPQPQRKSPVAHRYSLDFQSKASQVLAWGMEKLYWVHQTVQHAESEAMTPSPTLMWAG